MRYKPLKLTELWRIDSYVSKTSVVLVFKWTSLNYVCLPHVPKVTFMANPTSCRYVLLTSYYLNSIWAKGTCSIWIRLTLKHTQYDACSAGLSQMIQENFTFFLIQGGRGTLTKAILYGQFDTARWILNQKPELAFTETDNVCVFFFFKLRKSIYPHPITIRIWDTFYTTLEIIVWLTFRIGTSLLKYIAIL